MSQTPWFIDGVKIYDTSLSEEIAEVLVPPFMPAGEFKFSSGGREDIDVRMLGNGRPFVLEIVNPRRAHSIKSVNL